MRYECTVCRHVYDPADGDLENDVPPGTEFEELLDTWTCPCGAGREAFVEIVEEAEVALHG